MDFHERLYLGERIEYEMALQGLNAREVARRADITDMSMSRLRRSKHGEIKGNPTLNMLRRVAQALNIHAYELLMPPEFVLATPEFDLLVQLMQHANQLDERMLHALVAMAEAAVLTSAAQLEYCHDH